MLDRKKLEIELDRLHDSNLVEVAMTRERLSLAFIRDDRSTVRLELTGVHKLRVNDLLEGNIVLEAYLFDQSNYSMNKKQFEEMIEYLIVGDSPVKGSPGYELNRKSIDVAIESVIVGKLQCLFLTPSYGCSLACLHESIIQKNGVLVT